MHTTHVADSRENINKCKLHHMPRRGDTDPVSSMSMPQGCVLVQAFHQGKVVLCGTHICLWSFSSAHKCCLVAVVQ